MKIQQGVRGKEGINRHGNLSTGVIVISDYTVSGKDPTVVERLEVVACTIMSFIFKLYNKILFIFTVCSVTISFLLGLQFNPFLAGSDCDMLI